MTSSPPLQVAAGSFFRLECDHEQLFQPEYKRSNRTKGLKILRCFPHCCPEHIDRSYCGSSLSVSIRLAERPAGSAPPEPAPNDVLSVFARFEAVSDVSLRAGECVEVDKIQNAVQTETNLDSQWISGVLDRPNKGLVSATLANGETPLVFHLNSKAYSRWYYDWESGANKAQRLMKHVLKAYVVERVAVDMDDNFTTISSREAFPQLYRVLHVVTSPEFTVISYRRAPLEHLHAAHVQLTNLQIPQQSQVRNGNDVVAAAAAGLSVWRGLSPELRLKEDWREMVYSPSPARNASVVPVGRDHEWRTQASNRHIEVYEAEPKRRRRTSPRTADDEVVVHPLEDKLFWEHGNSVAVSVSKNLALLCGFLRWAPLRFYSPFVGELVDLMQQTVLDSISAESTEKDKKDCFSQLLLDHARVQEDLHAAGVPVLSYELETLLRVASHTMLWLHSRETCRWLRTFFRQNAACVLNKKDIRARFIQFLRELEEHLNTEVLVATELTNLANVAEEVIAAVYSCEYFYDRRPFVRRILGGQSFAGWRLFVAQMRDTYIAVANVPRSLGYEEMTATIAITYPSRNTVEKNWDGEWHLDPNTTQWSFGEVSPSAGRNSQDISFYSLISVVSQIVHLEIAIDIQESSLRVRSLQGMAGRLDSMHVVLDNKDRVFRVFPNGVTSGSEEGSYGDYNGEMVVEEPGQLVVFLEVFNWAIEEGDQSYHLRARIEYQQDGRLCVDGDILVTTESASFITEKAPYAGEMSLRIKRKSVEKATASQYHAAALSKDEPATAWTEHSKFHLSYRKVPLKQATQAAQTR